MQSINTWTVAVAAFITALATGLGAIPFFFFRKIKTSVLGVSNAVAAGLMLGASAGLIVEGVAYSPARAFIGVSVGILFISVTHSIIQKRQDLHIGAIQGADARKAILILGVMTLHSFSEGVGVGVSFGGGQALGELITAAIAIHNIPEGLAISLVFVPRGSSVLKAGWWSIFSSLPQPLMAVPAFLFVEWFQPILPAGLGFAAGAMLWMVFSELIPDSLENTSKNAVAISTTLAMTVMLVFQSLLNSL
jgi:ZIP family zinc transporter